MTAAGVAPHFRVWVPHRAGAELLRELPGGVEVELWDEETAPADGAHVRMVVPDWVPSPKARDVLSRLPDLQVVQALTAGVDIVRPIVPEGVQLCSARHVHDAATSEWILAAILASLRELPRYFGGDHESVRHATGTLDGSTVLIVGYGAIGAAVERRLGGFDVRVRRVARHRRQGVHAVCDLDGLLGTADIVVILLPSSPETVGLMNADRLALLHDRALVVNAARADVIDQCALLNEARRGRLRFAVDVADPDPLPAAHPLRAAAAILYTPHIAGLTTEALPGAYQLVAKQIWRVATGRELLNIVPA